MAAKKPTAKTAKKAPAKKAPAKKAPAKKPDPKAAAKAAPKAAAKNAGTTAANLGNEKALKGAGKQATIRPTISHMLGEIIWLMSQSPLHRHFAISDLDWMVAPAVANGQYRVFRSGKKPVGVAFWAYVNDETNARLTNGKGRIRPDEWKNGNHLWLIEVISPFSTAENKITEAIFADLVNNSFKGKQFRFSKTNPKTGKREVAEFKPKQAG